MTTSAHAERIAHIAEILAEEGPKIGTPNALDLLDGISLYLVREHGIRYVAGQFYQLADRLALQVPSKFDWSKAR